MHTGMGLLISFIVLGSLALSSAGMFLPSDSHSMWDAFESHRSLWNASAMIACGIFFVIAFALIDDLHEESSFYDLSFFPFSLFLILAVLAPPLAFHGHFNSLRVALVLMAAASWILFDCVVVLFGWGVLSFGAAWLALHCSAIAFVLGRAYLG